VQAVLVSVVALVCLTVQLAAAAPEQLAAGEAAPLLSTDAQGRPGDHFSPTCGSQGMSVCSDACISVAGECNRYRLQGHMLGASATSRS
jgi:hypothetical protein